MVNYIIYIIAFMITLPFIATILAYIIFKNLYSQQWKAIHQAVNWTTIFYIAAVTLLLTIIFNRGFITIILLVLLCMLAGIIIFQWKVNTEVELKKALKILWRICFLLFLISYIVLVIIGILQRLFR